LVFSGTGHVRNNLYVLGEASAPVYLLDGERPVLFEAGFTCLGEVYRKAIQDILGSRRPEILFLTHVHYDHCGSAAYLKESFPGLTIAASRKAGDILQRPNAQALIGTLNRNILSLPWIENQGHVLQDPFRPFDLDMIVSDNQRISLGPELTVEVIHTPGHTWDLMSYYIPEQRILIASEAAGVMDTTGDIVTEFLVDFEAYVNSIRRLATLDVEVLCQGHLFVHTDKDAPTFLRRSLKRACEYRKWVDNLLESEQGNIEHVIHRIKAFEYDTKPAPKQPEAAYLLNLEARVRHLADLRSSIGQ